MDALPFIERRGIGDIKLHGLSLLHGDMTVAEHHLQGLPINLQQQRFHLLAHRCTLYFHNCPTQDEVLPLCPYVIKPQRTECQQSGTQ